MNHLIPFRSVITTVEERLKPERVQQRLARLFGWAVTAGLTGLYRGFRFHRTETAAAFAAYAAQLASEHGQRLEVTVSWNQVTVLVPAPGGLTDAEFDFAEVLMQLPPAPPVAVEEAAA